MHKTATECIDLRCICCLRADRIRLGHPVVAQEDLSEEEKREKFEERHRQYIDTVNAWMLPSSD
jgi:hypothetical protein